MSNAGIMTMTIYNLYTREPGGMSLENIIHIFNKLALAGSLRHMPLVPIPATNLFPIQ